MNLDVFVLLIFGLISQVYGYNDPKCVEEHVGLYYVRDNSSVYYLPLGNFNRKYKLVGLEYEPSFISYNHRLKSLLFLSNSFPDQINEFNLETQKQFGYVFEWSTQRSGSQDNKKMFGEKQQVAFDLLTGNVLFIHENNGIYVCDLVKEQCAEILAPTSIERCCLFLDPTNGTMFWDENAFYTYFKTARMDGQEEQIVRDSEIGKVISIGMKGKSKLYQTAIEGRSDFYMDCKFYALYNDTGFLVAYHSNGKNERVDKRKPNTSNNLVMDSEPSKEILSLENPCKNFPCDDGVCVNIGNASAKCLRNWAFKVIKFEIRRTKTETTTKTDTIEINDSKGSFFVNFCIVSFIVTVTVFVICTYNCVEAANKKAQQKPETSV